MKEEWIYDTLECTIRITSTKALFVEIESGRHIWIPQSIVKNFNDIKAYDHDTKQILEVPTWFLKQKNIECWEG